MTSTKQYKRRIRVLYVLLTLSIGAGIGSYLYMRHELIKHRNVIDNQWNEINKLKNTGDCTIDDMYYNGCTTDTSLSDSYDQPNLKQSASKEDTEDPNKVYDLAEIDPEFPGGKEAIFEYIQNKLKYPKSAIKDSIQGRVIVQFIVEKDGRLSAIEVTRSIDPQLDKEAIRIISNMPKWKPGLIGNTPVRTKRTLPVTFRLQ